MSEEQGEQINPQTTVPVEVVKPAEQTPPETGKKGNGKKSKGAGAYIALVRNMVDPYTHVRFLTNRAVEVVEETNWMKAQIAANLIKKVD